MRFLVYIEVTVIIKAEERRRRIRPQVPVDRVNRFQAS